jgi:hypothetical protein
MEKQQKSQNQKRSRQTEEPNQKKKRKIDNNNYEIGEFFEKVIEASVDVNPENQLEDDEVIEYAEMMDNFIKVQHFFMSTKLIQGKN